jgi:osmotically-inducible protein OsmY
MKKRFMCLAGGILLSAVSLAPLYASPDSQQTAPDNTKVNKAPGATADQAKNNLSDREVMRQIRRDIVKDKSLSTYGHNVKIVSQHGKVTLRGPVHSDDEKMTIEKYAQKVAGDGNVTNELTVKSESK